MSFNSSITEAEISAVRTRLNEGVTDEEGKSICVETAEEWYARNVELVGEEKAVKRFKEKANAMLQQE